MTYLCFLEYFDPTMLYTYQELRYHEEKHRKGICELRFRKLDKEPSNEGLRGKVVSALLSLSDTRGLSIIFTHERV